MDADVLSRRCVLMRLLDFSYERYQKALRQSAGAVVIILPRATAAVPQDVIRVRPRPHLPRTLRSRSFRGKKNVGFGVSHVALGQSCHLPEPLPFVSGPWASVIPPPGDMLISGDICGCHDWGCFWH